MGSVSLCHLCSLAVCGCMCVYHCSSCVPLRIWRLCSSCMTRSCIPSLTLRYISYKTAGVVSLYDSGRCVLVRLREVCPCTTQGGVSLYDSRCVLVRLKELCPCTTQGVASLYDSRSCVLVRLKEVCPCTTQGGVSLYDSRSCVLARLKEVCPCTTQGVVSLYDSRRCVLVRLNEVCLSCMNAEAVSQL